MHHPVASGDCAAKQYIGYSFITLAKNTTGQHAAQQTTAVMRTYVQFHIHSTVANYTAAFAHHFT